MKKQIDIAIIEVGIGGRMDITNMFEPDISVITSIGLDHCQILGNTIEEIAKEKSAIFRPQKPCFYGSHPPPHSLTEYAANIGAKLQVLGKEFNYHPHTDNFTVTTAKRSYYGLPYPNLRGTIQLANAATALAVIDELHQNFPVSIQHIKSGLLNIHLNGRFQVLPGSPLTVLDVAHNPHAVANMVKNMLKLPFTAKTVAVFGVAKDKDVEGIASLCKDSFDLWFIAKINSARGMDVADIADILSKMGINQQNIIPCINCAAAYEKASLVADAKIICFGSFLVVEEILRK